MRISDSIADFISSLLSETEGQVELQRSTLADRFNCVPSQINYVIATRFTPEHGFIVESRRGGGGYIRISRITSPRDLALMHVVNSVGDSISSAFAHAALHNMYDAQLLGEIEVAIIAAALSDQALKEVPPNLRSLVRADIFKRCIMCVR